VLGLMLQDNKERELRNVVVSRAEPAQLPSMSYLAAWYAAVITVQVLLALMPVLKPDIHWWRLSPSGNWLSGIYLAAASVVGTGVAVAIRPKVFWQRLLLLVSTVAIYGLVFLWLIIARSDYSRLATLAMFVTAVLTIPAPYLLGTSRWLRTAALCALVTLTLTAPALTRLMLDFSQKSGEQARPTSKLIKTEYYTLRTMTHPGPKSRVHGGALAQLGNGYLLLTGDGHLYAFDLNDQENSPGFTQLPYQVPINGEEFAAAAGRPWANAAELPWTSQQTPTDEESEVINAEWFRTYGLLVRENGPNVRIFVSHDY
jgi:hypothetical protein